MANLEVVEVQCGVVFSVSATPTYSPWVDWVASSMGPEWNRLMLLHYAPFVVLKNTSNRPVRLSISPRVRFTQPPVGFRFKRISEADSVFITSSLIQADQMYLDPYNRGDKTYAMTLYEQELNGVGSGKVSLDAGQSRLFSPFFDPSSTTIRFDWQNNFTTNIQASPGWKGAWNGYAVNWLAGDSQTNQNGGFAVFCSREADFWDVEAGFTRQDNGWRIFNLQQDGSPHLEPPTSAEILSFPYTLALAKGAVSASSMTVSMVQPMHQQPVQPMFSVLGLPTSPAILPVLSDSDSNKLPDIWEMQYFGELGVSPSDDADGDGLDNGFEYVSGHSPIDATDRFSHHLARSSNGNITLSWSSIPGRDYLIEESADLQSWVSLWNVSGDPSPATVTSVDLGTAGSESRYFRIRLVSSP